MRSILPGLIVLCILTLISCTKNEDGLISGNSINLENDKPVSAGTWYVTLFSQNGQIETSVFYGYRFEFKSGNVVTASKSSETIQGSWQKINDSGKYKLILGFPVVHSFAELSEDWEILVQTSDVIRLKHVSGGNGGTDILEFGRQAVYSPGGSGGSIVAPTLPSGAWKISQFQDKDKNKTSNYTGYLFVFNANGVVTTSTPASTISGTWKGLLDSGKSKIIFTFPIAAKLQELNEDWELVSQSTTTIQLKNVSGGNGGTSTLTFTK